MIALPQDKTNIKAAPLTLDTDRQFNKLMEDYVGAAKITKERNDKNKATFVDLAKLTPAQLMAGNLQVGQTQAIHNYVDDCAKLAGGDYRNLEDPKNIVLMNQI